MIDYKLLKCIKCGNNKLERSTDGSELKCLDCGQHYLVESNIPLMVLPDEEEDLVQSEIHKKQGSKFDYKEHYKQDAIDFDYFQQRDPGTEHSERRVREFILAHLPKKQGRILDVGCGKAWVAQNCCHTASEVVSLDITPVNVKKALEKYPFKNHRGVVADSLDLPFTENSFDIVIASEIIEHIVFPERFIENLIHILKPGGVLIVTTPYKEKLQFILCIHCNRLTPRHAHIHSFDEKTLASLYSDKNNANFSYKTFGNKALIHLRTHVLLRYLTFQLWKLVDKIANTIYDSPSTIFVKWEKNDSHTP